MQVKAIVDLFEHIAPGVYQESYDNSGLITGYPDMEVTAIMLALDTTEEVVDEAISKGCNMIVAHHPIVFKGLKRFNGNNYVERTVIKAIKNNIAILAVHTNLDNVFRNGVNQKLASKLGLKDQQILAPKSGSLCKFFVYVPETHLETVKSAIFETGAGHIGNYTECSFTTIGEGTYKPIDDAKPYSGENGIRSQLNEYKLEVILPIHIGSKVLKAVKTVHPYEEVAYEIYPLNNVHQEIGSGVIGNLPETMEKQAFLEYLKKALNLEIIRYTSGKEQISKVAVCGGSGSFLISDAKRSGADAYVTADVKYHEFFDAENRLLLCDVGHYESEISTLEIFYEKIKEKFPNFAVIFCSISTNPIQYFK